MELNDWKADFPAIAASLEKARARGRAGQAYLFVGDHAERLMTFAKGWALTAACALIPFRTHPGISTFPAASSFP